MAGFLTALVSTLLVAMGISPALSNGRRLPHLQTPDTYTQDTGLPTSPAVLQLDGIRGAVGGLYEDIGQQVQFAEGPYRPIINDVNDYSGGIEALLSLGVGGNLPLPVTPYSPMTVPLGDHLTKSLYSTRRPITTTAGIGSGETLTNSLLFNRISGAFPFLLSTGSPLGETVSNSLLLNRFSFPFTTSPSTLTASLGESLSFPTQHRYSLPQSLSLPISPQTVSFGEHAVTNPLTLPLASLYSNHLAPSLLQTYPTSLYGSQLGPIQNLVSFRGLLPSWYSQQSIGGIESQTSAPYFGDVNISGVSSQYSPVTTNSVSY